MLPAPFVTVALLSRDFDGLPSQLGLTGARLAYERLRFRLMTGSSLPAQDGAKAWDARNVLYALDGLPRDSPILDCGAFNSAPLFCLAKAGYTHLSGIDLNPQVVQMPFKGAITYSVQDIEESAFDDASFAAVLCSSVIEHGVSYDRFLAEARRLLRPGGHLYMSTDIVAEGAATSHVEAFGAPWNPIRIDEIPWVCDRLRAHGFDSPAAPALSSPDLLPLRFYGVPLGFVAFFATAA